jgi:YVTN family beta-propeller protein
VPNSGSDTVSEIDPRTYKVTRTFHTGHQPQHVVPSWDLRTLWVNNDLGNTLTPINPVTGVAGKPVAVHDPYNLYFTPDGKHAVVMASADRQLVFRDPHTMAVQKAVPVPCAGVNHADFSADGRTFVVSCEFSGQMLLVDTAAERVLRVMRLPTRPGKMAPMPQDVKLSPDGRTYYVADMMSDGLWVLDAKTFALTGFISTGKGTHGLYVTRDSKRLIITNRGEGSISLMDFASRRLVAKWHIPGGGSPDMGGVSPDGKVLWVSGRYYGVVYAIHLGTGKLLARIKVGKGPHGLAVFPQPGRYSLGHTGVFR